MKKAKILIVDDRPENLLTLESLIDEPDVELVRAHSGVEALAQTLDHEFALVLLDVQMPGMDGYEVAELMRGNKKTRHIPIIFVTAAHKDASHIFKGYDSGAVDYLFKPLEPSVFKGKINIFLELYRQKEAHRAKTDELDRKLVELEELQQQLEETNEQLRLLSTMDSLTGLLNRRRFDEIYEDEWQRAIRNRQPLSLLLVDIDHFKNYNDNYGHVMGDECLKTVAHALSQSLQRNVDKIARYGGEEFVAILPNTDEFGAEQVAERMRKAVVDMAIKHGFSSACEFITVSIGAGTAMPAKGYEPLDLIRVSDNCLYKAKAIGRNAITTGLL